MSAQDRVAVICQKWQALPPACFQLGADLSSPWSVDCSLCPTHLFPLEYGCHGDAKPCREPVLGLAVKSSGKSTHFGARQIRVQIPTLNLKKNAQHESCEFKFYSGSY